MSCSICVESFNRSTRSPVKCPTCQATACSSCTETYLCSSTQDPHCMSCRVGWTPEVLDSCGLSKKFVRQTYKTHRENVLFERERALMPETQPHVERRLKIVRLELESTVITNRILEVEHKIHQINSKPLAVIAVEIGTNDQLECILERTRQSYAMRENIASDLNKQTMLSSMIASVRNVYVSSDTKKEARKFIRACPHNGCAGFLSTAWKCGVCENWTCPDCHDVIGLDKQVEHVCKPECLETARLIDKDSRPCPKCASMIFKIEGCDQMWCTQCATAFSWRTGAVEVGRIHNPHYYEYNRSRGRVAREIGDIPCGGMPSDRHITDKLLNISDKQFIQNVVRLHWHIAHVTIPHYNIGPPNNLELRIKYMMKTIPENVFKQKIQQKDKATKKGTDIVNVLNTYQLVSSEIMQRIAGFSTVQEFRDGCEEISEIRKYTNDMLGIISKRYSCVTPFITVTFGITTERS